jgi:methionyl aminopeptidase
VRRRKTKNLILPPSDIVKMRKAGRVAAKLLRHLGAMVRPGISTQDLDDEAQRLAAEWGFINAPLNYRGFPRSICTSVNQVICHGIPSAEVILREGDIIGIDVTPIVDGFHGDTCATFFVGEPSNEIRKLVEATAHALRLGIATVRHGSRVGDIGHAIQEYIEPLGYSVVYAFAGHAIGRIFHGDLMIEHTGRRGQGPVLETGMCFTIEPMINLGVPDARVLADRWTAVTTDGRWSAQFEHTLCVTPSGVEVLTTVEDHEATTCSPGGVVVYGA